MQNITIDIFICTYCRVVSLDRCLKSLNNISKFDFINIFVVDNDPLSSAKKLVINNYKHITYLNEKNKGLSFARNNAIDNGKSNFIAFIDDDEVITDKWLVNSLKFLSENECDVMFGGVRSIYPTNTEQWIKELDALSYPTHPHGTKVDASGTGNVFIRRATLNDSGCRFDPEFSVTGGEDSMLFRQLNYLGYKLIWNNEIEINEYVEPHRVNEKYILQRSYSAGQSYARSYLKFTNLYQTTIWFLKRLIKMLFDISRILYSFFSHNKTVKVYARIEYLKNLGQLSVLIGKQLNMYE